MPYSSTNLPAKVKQMNTKQDYLDNLSIKAASEQDLPHFFQSLDKEQLCEINDFTEAVIERHLQGLDKLMSSITQSMKYIPNVFLQMMAKKYVDPIFSARLTQKMKIKDVVSLTKGMPIEYVGEVTGHQVDNELSAEIMTQMKKKDIEPIMAYVCQHHPAKAVDIGEHLPDEFLKLAKKHSNEEALHSEQWTETRRATWQRMQAL